MTNKDNQKVDYLSFSIPKLGSLYSELKKELYGLRFKKSSKNLTNTSLISKTTKKIARIKTAISTKSKEEVSSA